MVKKKKLDKSLTDLEKILNKAHKRLEKEEIAFHLKYGYPKKGLLYAKK